MSASKRRDTRHPFQVPVTLEASRSSRIDATTRDLSRRGCRVRVQLGDLPGEVARFAEVLETVRGHLGHGFNAQFEAAGVHGARVVTKQAVLVRLEDTRVEGAVDMGCLFAEPLSEEEASLLGAPLGYGSSPRYHTEAERAREAATWSDIERSAPKAEAERPRAKPIVRGQSGDRNADRGGARRLVARPKQRMPILIQAHRTSTVQMYGRTELVTQQALMVRLNSIHSLLELDEGADLASVAVAFTDHVGDRVRLSLGPTSAPTWSGWSQITAFELAHDDAGDLLVTLAVERPLAADVLASVGL